MFTHDWFHGMAFQEQQHEARRRCAAAHFPHLSFEDFDTSEEVNQMMEELELRILIYLRDGFSYEVKQLAEVQSKAHLVFECMPVDEHYKVGAFVVSVPFDEIVRVEVFAVHPKEKPDDVPQITGFRGRPEPAEHAHGDAKPQKASR